MALQQFIAGKNKLYLHSLSIKTKIQLLKIKHIFIVCIVSLLLLSSSVIQAQQVKLRLQEHDHHPYHFGFFVAINQMDFSIKTNEQFIGITYDPSEYTDFVGADFVQFYGVNSQPSKGFTVGIIGNLKITPNLDLRFVPSLSFGERILNYSIYKFIIGENPSLVNITKQIISTNVDLPFIIKYKSKRAGNFRAYVLSGVKFTIDMAANSDKNRQQNEDFLRLKSSDIAFEAGVGFDYYFDFFKFGVEMKMGYGINNLLDTEGNIYADGVKSLHSKTFQLSLTFE